MMKAESLTEIVQELGKTKVSIIDYKIGEAYYCHIYSVDSGATIARSSAPDRKTAVEEATFKAKKRLLRNNYAF